MILRLMLEIWSGYRIISQLCALEFTCLNSHLRCLRRLRNVHSIHVIANTRNLSLAFQFLIVRLLYVILNERHALELPVCKGAKY